MFRSRSSPFVSYDGIPRTSSCENSAFRITAERNRVLYANIYLTRVRGFLLPLWLSSSSVGCFLRLVESEVGVSGESIALDNAKQAVGFRPRACRRVILDSYRSRAPCTCHKAPLVTIAQERGPYWWPYLQRGAQPIAKRHLVNVCNLK